VRYIVAVFRGEIHQMATEAAKTPGFGLSARVYYEDTDAGGVVYHARYLHFMERARTDWLRALGFEQMRLREQQGVLFTVRRAEVAFLSPARFDDLLTVTARLVHCGRASMEFEQEVLRAADGSPCCRARFNIACVDAERMRPTRIPEDLMNALSLETADGR
jgi:acyl-CoA thioester hydrolase